MEEPQFLQPSAENLPFLCSVMSTLAHHHPSVCVCVCVCVCVKRTTVTLDTHTHTHEAQKVGQEAIRDKDHSAATATEKCPRVCLGVCVCVCVCVCTTNGSVQSVVDGLISYS